MIDKATAVGSLLRRLENLEVGSCLEIRTYKRNRSVLFARLDRETFRVVECGFAQGDELVSAGKLRKSLKMLLRREFPRSTKIRVYDLGPCDPENSLAERKKL